MKFQAGGFALGLVAGLLLGLALALGVALYITKVPVPFIDKVPQRSADQDNAEAEKNKAWDPNAPLVQGAPAPPAAAASPASQALPALPGRDPAAILSGSIATPAVAPSTAPGVDPFTYFIQVGAYRRAEDAEAQRAELAMQGLTARVTERDQAGRTVYRVRLGPYDTRDEADGMRQRVGNAGFDGQLVRVQRP